MTILDTAWRKAFGSSLALLVPGQDKPDFMFNMMRIQDGKIVEHWSK